jgi:N-acetylmuramoyl-L-alanine amidase
MTDQSLPIPGQTPGAPTRPVSPERERPDRPRPPRRPLVSQTMIVGVSAGAVVLLIAGFAVFWLALNSRIEVPKLTGLPETVAQVRLAELGLEVRVTARPFSTLPEGTVIRQSPAANQRLNKGEIVQLAVSGGTDEFALPDVVGSTSALAKATLSDRALSLRVVSQASDQASGTVLSSSPGPGSPVRTGDVVVLTVASGMAGAPDLTPFALQGKTIVVDPVPPPVVGRGDITLEIGRRLQALLEASSASTQSTRSVADARAPEPARAKTVADLQSSLVVILEVSKTGPAGRIVSVPSTAAEPAALSESRRIASAIAQSLGTAARPVPVTTVAPGAVMRAANGPVISVRLGSLTSAADRNDFSNPQWSDRIARQIYRAIGRSLSQTQ